MAEPNDSDTLTNLPGETAWVRQLQAGDNDAYERLIRTFGPRMLAVARRYVNRQEDAEDVVQTAFCSAFTAIGGFRQGAGLGTWLHRIVVNAALIHLRRKRRPAEEPIDQLLPRFLDDGHRDLSLEPLVSAHAFVDSLGQGEARALLREAVAQLPASYRMVFLLRDVEERSTEETARLLGI